MPHFTVNIAFTTEADDPQHAARVVIDMLRTASIADDDQTDWEIVGTPVPFQD